MNRVPPDDDVPDNIDDRYRRAAALDQSRPSDSVRRAVLEHAARLATERRVQPLVDIDAARRAHRRWKRPAIAGTLAAAGLAGLLLVPRLLLDTGFSAPQAERAPVTAKAPWVGQAPSPPAPAPIPAPAARPSALAQAPARAGARNALASADAFPGRTAGNSPGSARSAPTPSAASAAPTASVARAAPAAPAVPGGPAAALRQAAERGDVPGVQALLAQRVDVDARDSNGRTALLLAVERGHGGMVDALLAGGADPNTADARGTTPLQAALAGGYPAIAAALRRAGAR